LAKGIDDDITRRDSMHATINSLPDPNYATLRALTLVSPSFPTESQDKTLTHVAPESSTRTLCRKPDERWELSHNLWV
jgi:hypothetical protein